MNMPEMMNSLEFAKYVNERNDNDGVNHKFSDALIEKMEGTYEVLPGTLKGPELEGIRSRLVNNEGDVYIGGVKGMLRIDGPVSYTHLSGILIGELKPTVPR